MDIEILAWIASFFAMALVIISYFVRKKEKYLLFQLLGILLLIASYFFSLDWLAAIGMSVGACRTVTFFLYEKRGARAPILWSFFFSFLSLVAFFAVGSLEGGVQLSDVILLFTLFAYAFIFRIRSLKVVRFAMLLPLSLSVVYNILTDAPPFTMISYSFELGANVASIFKYYVFVKKPKTIEK
jgi:hypothetical protein